MKLTSAAKGIVGVIGRRLQYAKLIGEQVAGQLTTPASGAGQAA